ncbi:MAG: hypothetical protein PHE86_01360 [Candidatus Marinimicrobia bacterium]|nr:hypothetical protein [Candidatus Neomarinimicrobiota bacterium]MDD5582895.1 hypothetical protein [Candidatus Neomarinimicrobiota bacterium]
MNTGTRTHLYDVLCFVLIFSFLLIHEVGFGIFILRSPALLFSLGLYILLKESVKNANAFHYYSQSKIALIILFSWVIMAYINTFFPENAADFMHQTFFIFLALLVFLMKTPRLIFTQHIRLISFFTTFIFLMGLYGLGGPRILFKVNFQQIVTLFVDQYLVSLFFLFLYFFIPPLMLYIGRNLFKKNEIKPFKDFVKFLLPFQTILYFSHAVLIIYHSAKTNQYLLSHYQLITTLFLVIMIGGNLLFYKPSFKKYPQFWKPLESSLYEYQEKSPVFVLSLGILLTLLGFFWVFSSSISKILGTLWALIIGFYLYRKMKQRNTP